MSALQAKMGPRGQWGEAKSEPREKQSGPRHKDPSFLLLQSLNPLLPASSRISYRLYSHSTFSDSHVDPNEQSTGLKERAADDERALGAGWS